MSEREISDIWNNKYKDITTDTDVDYVAYMFGSKDMGIPWCAGYAVGYMIVQKYLSVTNKSIVDILEVKPESILI